LPLILFPFVIIGHVTALLLNALHVSTVSANGLTWPYEIFYGLGSVIVGLLGLIYTYKACRLFANRNVSLISTWGVWFGTSLFYYLSIESSMSHAVSQGVVSAYLYYWLRDDWLTNWRQSLCLGLLLGLATIVRPQNALFGITILISLLSRQLSIRESLVKAMPIGAAAALVIAIQVVVYLVVYGSVTSSPYMIEGAQTTAGASFRWFKPQIWNVLFFRTPRILSLASHCPCRLSGVIQVDTPEAASGYRTSAGTYSSDLFDFGLAFLVAGRLVR
jgi:hypothetical protein